MTTQEVAARFNELAQENKYDVILSELYSNDCASIEPGKDAVLQSVTGMDAIIAKGKAFNESIEAMHGGHCSEPLVAGNNFTVTMGMDVTMKGVGRMSMDEVCVYQVADGKIVKELFFY